MSYNFKIRCTYNVQKCKKYFYIRAVVFIILDKNLFKIVFSVKRRVKKHFRIKISNYVFISNCVFFIALFDKDNNKWLFIAPRLHYFNFPFLELSGLFLELPGFFRKLCEFSRTHCNNIKFGILTSVFVFTFDFTKYFV